MQVARITLGLRCASFLRISHPLCNIPLKNIAFPDMGRAPCCDKVGLKKGPWTPEEDKILVTYIEKHGHGSWRTLPKLAGLQRCGKSCRLRWTNYLRPDIKRGAFSDEEERTIIQLHALLGNKWSAIASQLPGRTDNEIKNYWNTHLRKRLLNFGACTTLHLPPKSQPEKANTHFLEVSGSKNGASSSSSCFLIRHTSQWENARLQAEARHCKHNPLSILTNGAAEIRSSASTSSDLFLKIWNSEAGRAFRAGKPTPYPQIQRQTMENRNPTPGEHICSRSLSSLGSFSGAKDEVGSSQVNDSASLKQGQALDHCQRKEQEEYSSCGDSKEGQYGELEDFLLDFSGGDNQSIHDCASDLNASSFSIGEFLQQSAWPSPDLDLTAEEQDGDSFCWQSEK